MSMNRNCKCYVSKRPHTLGKLGNILSRDLSESLLRSLDSRIESAGELVRGLAEIEAGDACLQLLPARRHEFLLVVKDLEEYREL